MAQRFDGFPPAGLAFLRELAANNTKDWFEPRKKVFEQQVKAPMVALIEAVNAELAVFAPEYAVANPAKSVSRIFRDTRFSADKSPYHTHVSVVLPRNGAPKEAAAGFFLAVRPAQVEILGGVYMPGKEHLEALRRAFVAREAELRALVAGVEAAGTVGTLQGERLKRLPRGFESVESAGDLVRLTQAYFLASLPAEAALEGSIVGEISERFRLLTPFVRFLDEILAGVPSA
jgi:uncharacterized protein (TIGR02453 family)